MKNEKWSINDMPGLRGKLVIVTGGNSGLGFESVKAFAAKGAQVILAARSIKRGKSAKKKMLEDYPNSKINVMKLDLANLESIHYFVKHFKKQYRKLNILLNNAGIMMCPYGKTKDGFELQLGTNYLGHYTLTGLLLDYLIKTPKSRVVNVSSSAHKSGTMDFENLMFEKGKYTPMKSYGRSKLANLLFTYELQRRFKSAGLNCVSVAAHPGGANTNLARYLKKKLIFRILMLAGEAFLTQSAAMGALPSIRACLDPNVAGGDYYGPSGFNEMKGYPVKVRSNEASHDKEDAKRLWEVSEKLTKIEYNFE